MKKDLYTRLSINAKTALELNSERFPVGTKLIIEQFKKLDNYLAIPYGDMLWLRSHKIIEGLEPTELEKIFRW